MGGNVVYFDPQPDAANVVDASFTSEATIIGSDSGPAEVGTQENVEIRADVQTDVSPERGGCEATETPYDGIDNDCNGLVDDDQRLHAGHFWFCSADRGCFWFGNAPGDEAGTATYGYQGCFSSGRFRSLIGNILPGMLIATGAPNELHRVYYIGRNGRRYIFPTATTFATWFLDATSTVPIRVDAHACASVVQVSDVQMAVIQIGGNVTIRPGTVATGITTDPRRYVVSRGGVLRPLANEGLLFEVQPSWLTERVVMTRDAYFVTYSVGREIVNPSTYNWASEIGVTLDQDLGL